MRELPFVQVKATSRQVLAGPYGVLPAAFAQVTVGSCNSGVVTRRSRVECAASGRYISGALDSGAVHAVMHDPVVRRRCPSNWRRLGHVCAPLVCPCRAARREADGTTMVEACIGLSGGCGGGAGELRVQLSRQSSHEIRRATYAPNPSCSAPSSSSSSENSRLRNSSRAAAKRSLGA